MVRWATQETSTELMDKVRKLNSERHKQLCRVCGLFQEDPPWGADGKTATFNICDCCGVEFGYGDATSETINRFRQQWINNGAKWSDPKAKPTGWNLSTQLALIGVGVPE